MWIFTRAGLVSIVEDMHNKNRLVVRAREKKTLEILMPAWIDKIEATPTADYHFKLFLSRDIVDECVKKWVHEIDYTNFKASIDDDKYHMVLLSIWSEFRQFANSKNLRGLNFNEIYLDEYSEKKRKKGKQLKSKKEEFVERRKLWWEVG